VERAAVHEAADSAGMEVVHWVQCDRCNKWRIVPQRLPSSTVFWECSMRCTAGGQRTTCADIDDAAVYQ